MTQIATPDGVVSSGTWVAVPSGTLATTIDEVSADDADYNESVSNPISDTFEVSLSNVAAPPVNTGHAMHYRYGKSAASGKRIDFLVSLRQGASTVIAQQTHTDVGSGFTSGILTLTEAEAGNITDYSDLRIRIIATSVGGGAGRTGRISWAQLQVPDSPIGRLSLLGVGL
jgi:hypothetical protein